MYATVIHFASGSTADCYWLYHGTKEWHLSQSGQP